MFILNKKFKILALAILSSNLFAASSGLYLGGGLGYAMQDLSANGDSGIEGSSSFRGFIGYQVFSFLDAEAGYTYLTQTNNWNNLGNVSTTIYDISIEPGLGIPLTPVTLFGRFGLDTVSSNLNTPWNNQLFNTTGSGVEWGGGLKLDIPITNVFIRAEYINFGGVKNNNNSALSVNPNTIMLDAAYVF